MRETKVQGGYCLRLVVREGPSEVVMIKLRLSDEKEPASCVGETFPAGRAVKMSSGN